MGNDIGYHIGDPDEFGVPEITQWNLKHQECRVQYKDDEISVKVLCNRCNEEACRDGFRKGEHKCRQGEDISWDKPWNTTCGRIPGYDNDGTKLFCYGTFGENWETRCGDALAANDENYFDCVKNKEYHGTCLPEVTDFPWNVGAGWFVILILFCCGGVWWVQDRMERKKRRTRDERDDYDNDRMKRLDNYLP